MVTLAIIRTVVFDPTPVPSPCCEVPHAVTHRSGAGAACRAAVAEARSSARAATTAILDRTEAVAMRGSLPPDPSWWLVVSGSWNLRLDHQRPTPNHQPAVV